MHVRAHVVVPSVALGVLAALLVVYFQRGFIPGDAFMYLAAGERLNASHSLYAWVPGDRPVDINPPYYNVPFVSPPPLAVLFRVFALLPGDLGAYAWWACQLTALTAAIGLLVRRRPVLTGLAVIVLSVPLTYEIAVGNVNSFLLLGLVLTWRAFAAESDAAAGALVGIMTPVKLTPAVVGWWLIVERRWAAASAGALAALVVGIVSVLGAGLATHLQYFDLLRGGAFSPSPLSLGGIAEFVGVPEATARLIPFAAVVVGLLAVWLLRERPALSFAAAVITMIAGSPAVSINWYVLLFALLAPTAWPSRRDIAWDLERGQVRTKIAPSGSA